MNSEVSKIEEDQGPFGGIPDAYWLAFFGKQGAYYLRQLQLVQQGKWAEFNFHAFLFGFLWMAYRRMYVALFAVLIVLLILGTIEGAMEIWLDAEEGTVRSIDLVMRLAFALAMGTFGNRIYLWHAHRLIQAEMTKGPVHIEQILLERIGQRGGTAWWPILLVIVGAVLLFILGDLLTRTL